MLRHEEQKLVESTKQMVRQQRTNAMHVAPLVDLIEELSKRNDNLRRALVAVDEDEKTRGGK